MGNCGVGFAPVRPGGQDGLIKLMEGVEDIPGAALHEGIRWGWESFPQYMDALERTPRSLDYLVQLPHDPLRMYVMGERAVASEPATLQDIAAMRGLLREALEAGAAGFSTGRSDNHRTSEGKETPAAEASAAELTGIAAAFQGLGHGVVQMVSDFDLLRDAGRFDAEFDLVEQLAQAAGRPLSMTWLQRDPGGAQMPAIQARTEAAVARGLPLYLQTAARGIGVIIGLEASFHPFMGFPGYKELAQLPLARRAAALREPARKARILAEKSERLAGDGTAIPPLVDLLLARIDQISGRMFPLGTAQGLRLDYEPSVMHSFLVRAKQAGVSPLEALYDHFAAGDGSNLVYFPIFNYNEGSLDALRRMRARCSAWAMPAHMWARCATPASRPSCSATGCWGGRVTPCRWSWRWRCSPRAMPATWAWPTAAASRPACGPISTWSIHGDWRWARRSWCTTCRPAASASCSRRKATSAPGSRARRWHAKGLSRRRGRGGWCGWGARPSWDVAAARERGDSALTVASGLRTVR